MCVCGYMYVPAWMRWMVERDNERTSWGWYVHKHVVGGCVCVEVSGVEVSGAG